MSDLAHGNGLSLSTAYSYKDEAVEALAARRPSLPRALLAAKAAGYTRLITDGTLIHTDRISTPTAGVNLW